MRKHIKSGALALIVLGLAACGSDDNVSISSALSNSTHTYQIEIVNLTQNQPLSPAAIILHSAGYVPFSEGESASDALEQLAEGGDNTALLTAATSTSQLLNHGSTELISPRSKSNAITFDVLASQADNLYISVVSMLVNTNDAITGIRAGDISNMALNSTLTFSGPTWDAGTELNTEAAGTIPGPADNGIGYDATRDDLIDLVHIHPGVVSANDGLSTSVLNESHRFLNPSSQIIVTRTQ